MSEIVYIDVHKLWPHPDNPRKDLGDLTELAASIKANGIYQNLTVVPLIDEISKKWDGKSYRVIIGHRRLAAAKMAGLETVPCVIAEMTEKQQIQTMLLENMQRKDLKLYEEAQSFQTLLDFGDSVEEISQASGFSPTTIRRRVKLNELNQNKLKEVVDSRQIPLGDFDELAKIEDVEKRNELLQYVGTQDFRWKFNGALERQEMNKKLPDVKAWLKENKIKQLPQGKEYSTEYERLGNSYDDYKIKDWDLVKAKIKLEPGKKYFYLIDEFRCNVKLFLHKPAE
ncbi:MAG: ParB/RepB/Spo0J family partition protein, partial [Acidaminococcaceae bacterium]|nr:ParB/RepB/Spo0J family partition protein [Acidaminococcaceae bacterium]